MSHVLSISSFLRLWFVFFFINCIQKYMSCKGACLASVGPDQPTEVVDDAPKNLKFNAKSFQNLGACLYTRTQSMLSCDGSHQHTRRLCPCA
ncbi:glycosyltransferase family protein [Gossypium australe]|uniref:Glycosyltransferase family protein n=1 Tax=Gossypium australe TaxID=47621 RepID=A0A5B6VDU5_9ROSI|nr:glycosyltransferase family protein [Gossypium australe]